MNAWCCIQLPLDMDDREITALDFDLPIIGHRSQVVARILEIFPDADPSVGNVFQQDITAPPREEKPDLLAVLLTEPDFTMIIKLMGDRDWCNALVVVAWGEDRAMESIRTLVEDFNLLAFESQSGELLNFNNNPTKWLQAGRVERERRMREMYQDAE